MGIRCQSSRSIGHSVVVSLVAGAVVAAPGSSSEDITAVPDSVGISMIASLAVFCAVIVVDSSVVVVPTTPVVYSSFVGSGNCCCLS